MPENTNINSGFVSAASIRDEVIETMTVGEVAILARVYRLASASASLTGDPALSAALGVAAVGLQTKLLNWAARESNGGGNA